MNDNPNDNSISSTPRISQLDHKDPIPTIEEFLDQELGTPNAPSIQTMQIKEQDLPLITHKSTLLHTIITNKGNVMPKYLNYYQDTFLDKYPNDKFTPHRQAIFHIDSGANVHATNTRTDFLVFHPIQSVINLAVGSKAICKGFGAMLIQLASTDPPILLASLLLPYCKGIYYISRCNQDL